MGFMADKTIVKPNSANPRTWRARVPSDGCSCSLRAGCQHGGWRGCRLWSGPFTSAPPRSRRGHGGGAVVGTDVQFLEDGFHVSASELPFGRLLRLLL